MLICLEGLIVLRKLKSGTSLRDVYLGIDEDEQDIYKLMESKRQLKWYFKELEFGIFKNKLNENLNLIL
jgi:hypothetical protein